MIDVGIMMPDLWRGKSRSTLVMENRIKALAKEVQNVGAVEHMLGGKTGSMGAGAGFTKFREMPWSEFLSTGLQIFSVRIGSSSDYMLGRAPLNDFWRPLANPPGAIKIEAARHPGGFTLRLRRADTILSTFELGEG